MPEFATSSNLFPLRETKSLLPCAALISRATAITFSAAVLEL